MYRKRRLVNRLLRLKRNMACNLLIERKFPLNQHKQDGFFTKKHWHLALNINGPELMTMTEFVEIGNKVTGNHVVYQEVTDEENYQIFDAMGVPRTTDGIFKDGSEAPFSSDGMVTFAQAIREGKMDIFTDDFEKLTGKKPLSVQYLFENNEKYQIGERHSQDA